MVIFTEVVMHIHWNINVITIHVVHSARLATNSCSSWPWALETLPHTEMPSATLRPAFFCCGILEFCVDGELMTRQINCFMRLH